MIFRPTEITGKAVKQKTTSQLNNCFKHEKKPKDLNEFCKGLTVTAR